MKERWKEAYRVKRRDRQINDIMTETERARDIEKGEGEREREREKGGGERENVLVKGRGSIMTQCTVRLKR